MQAIARVNRIHEGKTNGLIIDYCGILKHLRQALATFAGANEDRSPRGVNELPRIKAVRHSTGIDFERLRKEFDAAPTRRSTTVQNLKTVIEQRLQQLLRENPLRTDIQQRYEQIVEEYNREKDRVTIESDLRALVGHS